MAGQLDLLDILEEGIGGPVQLIGVTVQHHEFLAMPQPITDAHPLECECLAGRSVSLAHENFRPLPIQILEAHKLVRVIELAHSLTTLHMLRNTSEGNARLASESIP